MVTLYASQCSLPRRVVFEDCNVRDPQILPCSLWGGEGLNNVAIQHNEKAGLGVTKEGGWLL